MTLNAALLQQSFELVAPTEAAKQAFAEEFYATFLRLHPEVEPLFAQTNREVQARKLMATLSLVLHVLTTTLRRLGRRHQAVGVRVEYYPMVAEALLAMFASRLGDQWTAQMQAAWTEAYEVIVGMMSEGYLSSPVLATLSSYGSQDILLSL